MADQLFASAAANSPLGQSAQKTKLIVILVVFIIAFLLILSGSIVIRNGKTAQGSATLITGIMVFGFLSMYLYFRGLGIEGEAAANYKMSLGGKLIDAAIAKSQ